MKKRLKSIISKFSKIKILVVGDLILDEYIYGNVERISPEAPVPVVWANEREFLPGGASNVAANIISLGSGVSLVGIVGKDDQADILLSELKDKNIDTNGVFDVFNRHTSVKTRILGGHQQVVRVDWENIDEIKQKSEDKVVSFIKDNIKKYDAIVIEDYGKGLITPSVVTNAVSAARANEKIVTVDPKEEHFDYYKGVTAITPNHKEAENAIRNIKVKNAYSNLKVVSDKLTTDQDLNIAGTGMLDYLGVKGILITLGDKGMRLFEKDKKPYQIDTVAQEVFDVSGAGDTVIAAFTLALACGATMQEASSIANFAAGIVVGRSGVATTTQKELKQKIENHK
ncbi:D-glycero-beta-D-manno-heptose-7-phosphate kinase [Candidatus Omnitrophota bacterium]